MRNPEARPARAACQFLPQLLLSFHINNERSLAILFHDSHGWRFGAEFRTVHLKVLETGLGRLRSRLLNLSHPERAAPKGFATIHPGDAPHHVGQQHLHRYLTEFDYRYNTRKETDSFRTVRP